MSADGSSGSTEETALDCTSSFFSLTPIGVVESCFKEKFGIPRQPGLAPSAKALIRLLPPWDCEQAFVGLEQCSHLWIQFIFHRAHRGDYRPKVRPPRLGGNRALGVFATRSPNRPNALGLSVVRNEGLVRENDALVLRIAGVDLLHGTPVVDIKPYLPYADSIDGAAYPLASEAPAHLPVAFSAELLSFCREYQRLNAVDLQQLVREVLQQDPRPSYQRQPIERVYGMRLLDVNVRWHYRLAPDGWQIEVIAVESDV